MAITSRVHVQVFLRVHTVDGTQVTTTVLSLLVVWWSVERLHVCKTRKKTASEEYRSDVVKSKAVYLFD